MTQYEKMLFEILINYIPKIRGSLEDIVIELKRLNDEKKMDNIIQYELFKNSRTNGVKNIEFGDLEMKFKTHNSNKYYPKKINNNCKKITKYTLTETSQIVFKNLPPKLSKSNVIFIKDDFDLKN